MLHCSLSHVYKQLCELNLWKKLLLPLGVCMSMLLKAQPLVPNRQKAQALALSLTNLKILGKILNIFEKPFSHFSTGENISPYLEEVVVMVIVHGLLPAHSQSLTNRSHDGCGCCHHERVNQNDNSETQNTTVQHNVSANTNSPPVALSRCFLHVLMIARHHGSQGALIVCQTQAESRLIILPSVKTESPASLELLWFRPNQNYSSV